MCSPAVHAACSPYCMQVYSGPAVLHALHVLCSAVLHAVWSAAVHAVCSELVHAVLHYMLHALNACSACVQPKNSQIILVAFQTLAMINFIDYHMYKIHCCLSSLDQVPLGTVPANVHKLSKYENKLKDKMVSFSNLSIYFFNDLQLHFLISGSSANVVKNTVARRSERCRGGDSEAAKRLRCESVREKAIGRRSESAEKAIGRRIVGRGRRQRHA